MKRIIISVLLIISVLHSFAKTNLTQAQNQANIYYGEGRYSEAAEIYEALLTSETESAALNYNLGNAYYKMGEIGKAILNYERALLIAPDYSDAKHNLVIAQLKIVDKIDATEKFFISRWTGDLINLNTSNRWAYFSAILFVTCAVLMLIYTFGKGGFLRRVAFFSALAAFVISLTMLSFAFVQKNKIEKSAYAIVMDGSVSVKSSPDVSGTDLFVLHEGSKVKIKSTLSDWVEIELDGNVGWVRQKSVEKI